MASLKRSARRVLREDRAPVRRFNAPRYLLYLLVSFGLSVLVTRLFLELTGYPKIGGDSAIHVAHVLWGGLLLFLGALVVLLFANQWTLTVSSILWGAGVGLFIDEVGKFITANNDYFVPIAAPIIYGFFLVTAWIYVQARRPPARTPRAEMYGILDMIKEVLDHDLDPEERVTLEKALRHVRQETTEPNLSRLAAELLDFIGATELSLAEDQPTPLEEGLTTTRRWLARWVGQRQLRWGLVLGYLYLATVHVSEVAVLNLLWQGGFAGFRIPIRSGNVEYLFDNPWVMVIYVALSFLVGLLYVVAAYALARHRERQGGRAGLLALLMSLTVVNLITYYFSFFEAMGLTIIEITLLIATLEYRRRYLKNIGAVAA